MENEPQSNSPKAEENAPTNRTGFAAFWQELKQRKVVRAGIAYLVVGLAIMEGGDIVLSNLGAPQWAVTALILLVIAGFPIAIVASWMYDLTPEGIRNTDTVREEQAEASGQRVSGPSQPALFLFLAAAVPTFIFGAGTLYFFLRAKSVTDELIFVTKTQFDEMTEKSIAVLPFDHRSNQEEDLFFTDGFHDELITHISKIRDIRTIARTSVMGYRGTTQRMSEIGEELNVRYLVEGGVQRGGDEIRIVVQLIDTTTEGHVWTEIYTREMSAKNVFDIQSEISHEIARNLEVLLSPSEEERLNKLPTENLAALEAYFKGKELMADSGSVGVIDTAIDYFEKAISLDPEFANSHAHLAGCQIYLMYASQRSREQLFEKAQVHVDRALEIDPDHVEALFYVGWLEEQRGNIRDAIEIVEKVIRINPNYARAHARLAQNRYTLTGDNEERVRHLKMALSLDPGNLENDDQRTDLLQYKGEWEEMLRVQKQKISENPQNAYFHHALAGMYFDKFGRYDEAIIVFRKKLELDPDPQASFFFLAFYYFYLGDTEQAIAWLEKYVSLRPEGEFIETARRDIHVIQGNDTQLKQILLKYLEKKPRTYWHLLRATDLDLKLGNAEEAMSRLRNALPELFDPAVELNPNNHWEATLVAVALAETGENEQADRLATKELSLLEIMGRLTHMQLLRQVEAYHATGDEAGTVFSFRSLSAYGCRDK